MRCYLTRFVKRREPVVCSVLGNFSSYTLLPMSELIRLAIPSTNAHRHHRRFVITTQTTCDGNHILSDQSNYIYKIKLRISQAESLFRLPIARIIVHIPKHNMQQHMEVAQCLSKQERKRLQNRIAQRIYRKCC